MKKILFFLSFLAFVHISHAQLLGKKLKKHESSPVYLWFNPVINVDTTTLLDDGANAKTLFLVEGYLSNGDAILVLITGKTLRFLLQLPTKEKVQDGLEFEGFLFTGESLGKKSIQTEKAISKSDKYFPEQEELLKRKRLTEKWELWGETPKKVRGHLKSDKFVPLKDKEATIIKYSPPH